MQSQFLRDLAQEVYNRGGYGVVYWEPAWVSTGCETQWGMGSHWENATFFDFTGELILDGGVNFLEQSYGSSTLPPTGHGVEPVTFQLDMSGTSYTQAYVTGDFSSDGDWIIIPMVDNGNGIFTYETKVPVGSSGGYYFLFDSVWTARETVPSACATAYNTDRGYSIESGKNRFAFKWSSCEVVPDSQDHSSLGNVTFRVDMTGVSHSWAYVTGEFGGDNQWKIIPMNHEGDNVYSFTTSITEGKLGAYYFLNGNDWGYREAVPAECSVLWWNIDRGFSVHSSYNTFSFAWQSCAPQ